MDRKNGNIAKRSMMFIGSCMNFFLAGQIIILTTNSAVKKITTVLSMMSIMVTTVGYSESPNSSSWSSSAVEIINVNVDTTTADREVKAKMECLIVF